MVASMPISRPPAVPMARAVVDVPLGASWLARMLRLLACSVSVTLATKAVTVGLTVASALDTPTDTPELTEKPRASSVPLGSALAPTTMSSALTLLVWIDASTVGVTVEVTTEPDTATAMLPKAAEVASTLALASALFCASSVRSPVMSMSLPATSALVEVSMLALVPAPPPARAAPPRKLTVTATATACALVSMVLVSSATTRMPAAAPRTVALLTEASTVLRMVLLARATPMAAEPPYRPNAAATEAASEVPVIMDVSRASTVIALPTLMPLPRVPSTKAFTDTEIVLLVAAPAPLAAMATPPPASAAAMDAMLASMRWSALALTFRSASVATLALLM